MLGGALEARRGRGEHTAEGARRLSGTEKRRLEMKTGGWHRVRVFTNTVLSQPTCPA